MLTESLIEEINQRCKLHRLWPWVAFLGPFLLAFVPERTPIIGAIWLLAGYPAAIYFSYRFDRNRRSTNVQYDQDTLGSPVYKELCASFGKLAASQKVWQVTNETAVRGTADYKRNAGASSLIKRSPIRKGYKAPPGIITNAKILVLHSRPTIYFFPDAVVVVRGRKFEHLNYDDVVVLSGTTRFIESGLYPREAPVVDHTWQYVNKGGGPDKRMKNNRKLSIVRYDELTLDLLSLNARVEFHVSAPGSAFVFQQGIERASSRDRLEVA